MKTKEEIIKEVKNLGKEEYWDYEEKNLLCTEKDQYCIDKKIPHRPYFHMWNDSSEIYYSRDWISSYNRFYYPYKEEIEVEDIIIPEPHIFYAPWVKEKKPIVVNDELEMHYSTDPKVWDWDWKRIKEDNYYSSDQIYNYFYGVTDEVLVKIREEFIKKNIQCKFVSRCDTIDLRVSLSKRNYPEYRKTLIKLSRDYKIYIRYVYEEIRDFVKDIGISIIA